MEQGLETVEGATGSVLEETCETLCYPSVAEVAAAEVAQAELQRGVRPKEPTPWQTPPTELAAVRAGTGDPHLWEHRGNLELGLPTSRDHRDP